MQLCLRVKFNNARENYWKPLFNMLISVRILLKQLDYSLSIEFANLQYFNSTFMNLKIVRLVLNVKCKIVAGID